VSYESRPFVAPPPVEAESPSLQFRSADFVKGSADADTACRKSRLSVLVRRVRFLARFAYWTCRHGSMKHAGWVCNFEGLWW
jgi:hypothetical protein